MQPMEINKSEASKQRLCSIFNLGALWYEWSWRTPSLRVVLDVPSALPLLNRRPAVGNKELPQSNALSILPIHCGPVP